MHYLLYSNMLIIYHAKQYNSQISVLDIDSHLYF